MKSIYLLIMSQLFLFTFGIAQENQLGESESCIYTLKSRKSKLVDYAIPVINFNKKFDYKYNIQKDTLRIFAQGAFDTIKQDSSVLKIFDFYGTYKTNMQKIQIPKEYSNYVKFVIIDFASFHTYYFKRRTKKCNTFSLIKIL